MAFGLGSRGGRAPLSEINVTPLVDVMLVLLIIFMVSAPMLTRGVDVDLPKTRAPRMEQDQSKLMLVVTKEKRVFLGESEIPAERLKDALLTNERIKRDRELYVHADQNVPYGFVVQVLATIREAGIEKMGLVTDPKSGGPVDVAQVTNGSENQGGNNERANNGP